MEKNLEVLKKMLAARKLIAANEMKKAGRNSYSGFDYFTPEQVKILVDNACFEFNLLTKFDLIRGEMGLTAYLAIIDLDSGESINFSTPTEIPEIKATNAAQRLGGTMTFTERYLKMTAFGIADNTLDFDSKDGKENKQEIEKPVNKLVLQQNDLINIEKVAKAIINGYSFADIQKKWSVSHEVAEIVGKKVNELKKLKNG